MPQTKKTIEEIKESACNKKYSPDKPYISPSVPDSVSNITGKRKQKRGKRTGSPYGKAKDPYQTLLWKAKSNARPGYMKGNGISRQEWLEYDITRESLINQYNKQNGCCYWTGFPIDMFGLFERDNPLAPSLERRDCDKGYTQDNVVIAVRWANLGRGTCPEDKWLVVVDKIRKHFRGEKVDCGRILINDFIEEDANKGQTKE